MPKNIKILILLLIGIVGCDVPGIIEVENSLKEEVTIFYSMQNEGANRTKNVKIKPNEKEILTVGFGSRWDEAFIREYSNDIIDTITIIVGNKNYYCNTRKCKALIFNLANRKSRRKILLTINTNLISQAFIEKEGLTNR